MLNWGEKLLMLVVLGVLGMVAALVWGGFIVLVGLLFALGLKLAGVL